MLIVKCQGDSHEDDVLVKLTIRPALRVRLLDYVGINYLMIIYRPIYRLDGANKNTV